MIIVNFSTYLGQIKNDTDILGKSFIFKCITEKDNKPYTFDVILFVHETVKPFVTTNEEDEEYKEVVYKLIFEQYTLKQLLEAEYEN